MFAEVGHLFLALALGFTGAQIAASCLSFSPKWATLGRVTAFLQTGCVTLAFLTLVFAFLYCDFSLSLVFQHNHTRLPWYYRIAATWGNHGGSFLLFLMLLSGINTALAFFLPSSLRSPALFAQGAVIFLLLLFLILTSHPFQELPFTPLNGQSLTPLLQDKSLLIHPPFLYLGYVGFSGPFSLAFALLWTKKSKHTALLRPWILFPWAFLTAGIALGSWWAYYELGWGGWWFWDPVETISLMPWLTATATLHLLTVPFFSRWTLLLSLLTFGLCLLGTFLIRSGLITSLHSFADDPRKGYILLSLVILIIGSSLIVWGWKSPRLKFPPLPFFSQENTLLGMALLLVGALVTLLVGVLFPLFTGILGGDLLSVGAPYFEKTTLPLLFFLFFLMPVGMVLHKDSPPLLETLALPLILVLIGTVSFLYFLFPVSLMSFCGTLTSLWIVGGTYRARQQKKLSLGATLAHLGVSISLLGLSIGGGFREDISQVLGLNDTLIVAGIPLTLEAVEQGKTPTFLYEKAKLTSPAGTLTPEKRLYQPQNILLGETAIASNGFRDLYVVLGPYQGDQRWLIQASFIPLAPWVWGGAFLMVMGAFAALWKRKKRRYYQSPAFCTS